MVDYIELSDDDVRVVSFLQRPGPSVIRERDPNVYEVEVVAAGSKGGASHVGPSKGRAKGKKNTLTVNADIVILDSSPMSQSSDRLPDIDDMFASIPPCRSVAVASTSNTLRKAVPVPVPLPLPAAKPAHHLPTLSSGIDAFSSSPVLQRSPSPVARARAFTEKVTKRQKASHLGLAPCPAGLPEKRAQLGGSQEEASDRTRQTTRAESATAGTSKKGVVSNGVMDLGDIPASFWDDLSDLEDGKGGNKKRDGERAAASAEPGPPAKKAKKAPAGRSSTAAAPPPASTAGLSAAEKKTMKEAEKTAAKAQKELDKAEKARFTEANKLRTSRVDTLRQITMHISADLDQPTSLLFHSLPILRAKFETNASQLIALPEEESAVPGVIRFKRFVTARYDPASKVFIPLPRGHEYWQDESTLLLVVEAKDVVEHISRGRAGSAYGLCEWFAEVRDTLKWRGRGRSQVVLMIHGLKAYHAKTRSLQAKAFRKSAEKVMAGQEAEAAAAPAGRLTPEDIDKEFARLHVLEKCFQVHSERKEDLEEWIWNLACDVAIRPYKLIKKSHLPFSTEEVTRKGRNPKDTYQLMLEQIPLITSSSASGIVEQYPSFHSLMEGMERMERREAKGRCSRAEVETFLKDCPVRNLVTGHESNKALGVARSTKVYNVFRGIDSLAML